MTNLQPEKFRYTITIRGTESFIAVNAPDGWRDEFKSEYNRSQLYWGVIRSLSLPMKWVRQEATLLRDEYYTYGANGRATVLIEEIDTDDYLYKPVFNGRFDFAEAIDEDNSFSVTAIENNIETVINGFKDVKYEFEMDDPNAVDIQITPIKLQEIADFLVTPSLTDQQPGFTSLDLVNNETKATQSSVQGHGYGPTGSPDFSTSNDWFFTANTDTDITIEFKGVQGYVQSILTGTNRFRWQLVNNSGTVIATLFDITVNNANQNFDVNTSVNVSMLNGEKLFMYQRLDGATGSSTGFVWTAGEISATYFTESPASMCKAFRPKYLFEQLVKKMNGGFAVDCQSYLLDEWQELTITCGDAIRGLAGAKLKTSFTDFFKSINAVLGAAFAVENNKPAIELKSAYLRNVQVQDLEGTKEHQVKLATELMYNSIKVGYKDQTYDEINGKDEVNSEQQYFVNIENPAKELDLISEYRADAYGIEFTRINLKGKKTTDSDSDNDVFFIYINPTPVDGETYYQPFTIANALATTIQNVTAGDSYYNWNISPKHNLLRHGDYLHSIFYGLESGTIQFASGLKNTAMITITSSEILPQPIYVQQDADVQISSLPAPIFIPFFITFTAGLPKDIWKYINSQIYGYIRFEYANTVLKGYMQNVSLDLGQNSEQQQTVLLTPDNDLRFLIR